MKILINTFFAIMIIGSNNFCLAQNYDIYQIKEQFDEYNKHFVDDYYSPCDIYPSQIPNTYGDGMSYVLESYIKMYETTKDKAYLIKFINNSICMQENRQDTRGVTNDPRWAYDPGMYQDGLIIWSMAHFVNLIFGDYFDSERPEEYYLPLPQIFDTKITDNNFYLTWDTYGDFADWLRVRTEETLDWYTYGNAGNNYANYWADDTKCYVPSTDHSDRAQIVNQQSGFARALFYIGITDPNTDLLHKAAQIAIAYKGTYTEHHPDIFNSCAFPSTHVYDVLDLQSNNSYIWKTNGWREILCSDYQNATNDYEDISHAITDLIFPRAINNRLESNNVMLFDDYDMIKFRNTFSFNIYAGTSSGCPQFHSGVDGDDVINYNSNFNGLNTLKIRSLSWMPFYKYDIYSSTPDVYEIVMDYYVCDILNSINNIATGLDFNGLSEVVAAQWDKECVNLTLYNRDVVYDQDFVVKNKLIIAPQTDDDYHSANEEPFAEPKTFTGAIDRFIIDEGINVNFVAGESIEILSNFETKEGGSFSFSIDNSACTDGNKRANQNGNNNKPYNVYSKNNNLIKDKVYNDTLPKIIDKQKQEIYEPYFENSLAVYPNPFNETTNIKFSVKEKSNITLKIIDLYGHDVFNEINNVLTEQGNYSVTFNGQNLSKGIYFCVFYINGQLFKAQKIILIK